MTQVIVRWDEQDWELDTERVEIAQAFVIKDATKDDQYPAGRSLGAWELGLKMCEPGCVRGLYWLMLQQAGHRSPLTSVPGTFPVLAFHRAWAEAAGQLSRDPAELARALAELDRQRDLVAAALERATAERDAAEPEGPTSPRASRGRRSPAPAEPST